MVVLGFERATAKPTGRSFDQRWMQFLTFRDGKVARFREFPDTAVVRDAFVPARAVVAG